MASLTIDRGSDWDWVRIGLEKANAVGPAMLDRLAPVLEELSPYDEGGPARPVVFTGRGESFSAGLDLTALIGLDRAALEGFLIRFRETFLRLACLPRPTVAAVNGHAIGAGCLLALACDRRIAAGRTPQGREYRIGLKVSAMGLPLPPFAAALVRSSLPNPSDRLELTLSGDLYVPVRAAAMGMIDEIVAPAELERAAAEEAERLTHSTGHTAALLKEQMKPKLYRHGGERPDHRDFLDSWFSASTQRRLREALTELGSRSGPEPP